MMSQTCLIWPGARPARESVVSTWLDVADAPALEKARPVATSPTDAAMTMARCRPLCFSRMPMTPVYQSGQICRHPFEGQDGEFSVNSTRGWRNSCNSRPVCPAPAESQGAPCLPDQICRSYAGWVRVVNAAHHFRAMIMLSPRPRSTIPMIKPAQLKCTPAPILDSPPRGECRHAAAHIDGALFRVDSDSQ